MKKVLLLTYCLFATTSVCLFAQEIREGDDFYLHVNKTWLDTTQNPSVVLKLISEKTDLKLLKILKKNAQSQNLNLNSPEKKLADYYNSGLDTVKIETRGIQPLLKYFDRIDKIKNIDEFFNLVATLYNEGHGCFLGIDVTQDDKNSQYMALFLTQIGLTLGIPSVYSEEGEIFDAIRNSYKKYNQTIFELIGQSKEVAEKNSNDVFEFEKEMANSFMPEADLYNPDLAYNKMTLVELEKLTPLIHWSKLFKIMNIKTESVIIQNPKYLIALNTLVQNKDLEVWKNKLKGYIILKRTAALSFQFREALVQLKSVFTGGKIYTPRQEELLTVCNNEILGQLYIREYFNQKSKEKIENIALNIKKAFRVRLSKNQWMTEETKNKALKKLDALGFKIGYPESIHDYKEVKINTSLFFENMDSWSAYNFKLKTEKIDEKIDKKKWHEVLPQTANAYYDPVNNELIFPAAILQEPVFNQNHSDAVLYGSIGYIIGHELTHGFDKNGKKYNDQGNLQDWWDEKDEKSFENLCSKLINQFNQYEVAEKIFINGEQTLSENIADLGGLTVAYDAYKLSEMGKKNDTEFDKQFFISFAKVWREKLSEDELRNMILRDTHTPPKWRVNGVLSNFTPFYEVFNINKKEKLYKDKKDRIVIW
ncbi:M13-type metalloendopeptidase [Flavobacterium sp.]|jgi:putative endopeptidase|uniref:M13-type metalloendopeptidase n=2 Tax=Flavobacterium sp. TaxID=239 RepID=UPI0037BFA5E2